MGSTLVLAYLAAAVVLFLAWRLAWRPRALPGVHAARRDGAAKAEPVLLIGHRGTRTAKPENTLEAFRFALDAGLDGIEFDVQRSADGALVITHDSVVDGKDVRSMSHAELRAKLPALTTLDALFELARAYPGRLLNLEIKAEGFATHGLERQVAKAVRESGLADRVLVSSFNPLSLARLRLAAPELRTGLLFAPDQPRWLSSGASAPLLHVDALHPHHDQVTDGLMRRARAARLSVNTWTVNDPAEVRRLYALGVDGIMADDPTALRAAAGATTGDTPGG